MKCPVDGTELRMAERQGIEIDYCPQCRGVWLDRGELDKIAERSAATPYPDERDDYGDADRSPRDAPRDSTSGRPRRRRSVLEDLLDFG